MLKKILLLILIASLLLLMVGCEDEEIRNIPPNNEEIEDDITPQNGADDIEEEIEEEGDEDVELYPEELINWRGNMRKHFVAGVIDVEDDRYIIVNWGQQETTEHQVSIVDIRGEDDVLKVEVLFEEPEEIPEQIEDEQREATNPVAVEKITKGEQEVEFIAEGVEEYIPRIVGREPVIPFKEESANLKVMEFDKADEGLYLLGLARVFEATVNYAFETEAGDVLEEGYTTALTGGPDWGEFELEGLEYPQEAHYLTIFSISAKDGSRQDELRLEL